MQRFSKTLDKIDALFRGILLTERWKTASDDILMGESTENIIVLTHCNILWYLSSVKHLGFTPHTGFLSFYENKASQTPDRNVSNLKNVDP